MTNLIKNTTIFIFLLIITNSYAINKKYKKIDLLGLKIFKPDQIIQKLNLNKLSINVNHYSTISGKIIQYYQHKGYPLAATYLVKETSDYISIFIDEGQLGQIKLFNLNSMKTLRIRYELGLDYKIYNPENFRKKLYEIQKKYNFSKIEIKLKKSINYNESTFQIDYILGILFPEKTSFLFFKKYGYRYNLDIYFYKNKSEKSNGFIYGIKLSKSDGFCPFVDYNHYSLFFNNDRYFARGSFGLFYLFDLKPKEHPSWSYLSFQNSYYLPPLLNKTFVPDIMGSTYWSKSSRSDLGLTHYEYIKNIVSLNLEFNIIKKTKFYIGSGIEKIYIYNGERDEDAEYSIEIDKETNHWKFLKNRIYLKPFKQITSLKLSLEHTYYFNHTNFNKLDFQAEFKTFSQKLSLFKTRIEGLRVWGEVPFHHEISVYNSVFKGFMGQAYHTHKTLRMENSYRTSIYKDYLFIGVFMGSVYFKGSGYDLEGNQKGIVGGPSFHIIFLDQFQFELFYGRDYLFSQKESQNNLLLYLSKKW